MWTVLTQLVRSNAGANVFLSIGSVGRSARREWMDLGQESLCGRLAVLLVLHLAVLGLLLVKIHCCAVTDVLKSNVMIASITVLQSAVNDK